MLCSTASNILSHYTSKPRLLPSLLKIPSLSKGRARVIRGSRQSAEGANKGVDHAELTIDQLRI